MALVPAVEEDILKFSLFIDFDQKKNVMYNNLYLPEFDVVVKQKINKRKPNSQSIKIEKFNLAKYTYLLDY